MLRVGNVGDARFGAKAGGRKTPTWRAAQVGPGRHSVD